MEKLSAFSKLISSTPYDVIFDYTREEIYKTVIFILENQNKNSEKFLSIMGFLYNYSIRFRKYEFAIYLAIIISEIIEKDKNFKITDNYNHDNILEEWKKNININNSFISEDNNDVKIIEDYNYYSQIYFNFFTHNSIKIDVNEFLGVSFLDRNKKLLGIDELEKISNSYLLIIKKLNNKFNDKIIDNDVLIDKLELKNILYSNQKIIINTYINCFNQEYYDNILKNGINNNNDKKIINYLLNTVEKIIEYTSYVLTSEIDILNQGGIFYDKDEQKIIELIDILNKFYLIKYTLFLRNNDNNVEPFLDNFRDIIFLASKYTNDDKKIKLNKIIDTILTRINTAKHLTRS